MTKYYLQDTRSYVGNDLLFWRLGGGYTTDVSLAEVFDEDKAFRQNKCRDTDRPWPIEYIDSHTRPAVDHQYINYDEAIQNTVVEMETYRD